MNISLAVFAKNSEGTALLSRLLVSATRHVEGVFPDAVITALRFKHGRIVLYNSNRLASAWAVPVWIEDHDAVISVSAPPIPRDEAVAAAGYEAKLIEAAADPSSLSLFNSCYFGASAGVHARWLRVWSDPIGLGRSYYVDNDRFFAASNSLAALTYFHSGDVEIDDVAWRSFAGFGWFIGDRTPFVGIKRLPPATVVTCDSAGVRFSTYGAYDDLVRARDREPNFDAAAAEMKLIAGNATRMMVGTPGIYLSGGKDSRVTTAAWIASGAPASVTTYGTIPQEAVIAERLIRAAEETIDLAAQGVTHRVLVGSPEQVKQSLQSRIDACMKMWDGDHAPIRMTSDVEFVRAGSVHIGGGGGEIAHGNYYQTEEKLRALEALDHPTDRLVSYFAKAKAALVPEGDRLIAEQLGAIEEEAQALGITGPTILDYFYFRERFRRWVVAGNQTHSVALYASPAFIRLAFDVTPRDRLNRVVHRRLTEVFMPCWQGIEYFKAAPSAVDMQGERGLRLWREDTRDFVFDTITKGLSYQQFWDQKQLIDLAIRVALGKALNTDEALIQRILWFEGFVTHATRLASRVREARNRALGDDEIGC